MLGQCFDRRNKQKSRHISGAVGPNQHSATSATLTVYITKLCPRQKRVGIAPCTISERRKELLSLMWRLGHVSIWHCAAKSAIQTITKKTRGTMALLQCLVGKDGPNVALVFIRTQDSADKKRIRYMVYCLALNGCEQYHCIYLPRSRLQKPM